jgi:hypothetical protein
MEIAGIMDRIKSGRQITLPAVFDLISQEIAGLCDGWARNLEFTLDSHKEAPRVDPAAACWISFAQNAALGAHEYILEGRPEFHKVPGVHADEGGEVLEGMYAECCIGLEESR